MKFKYLGTAAAEGFPAVFCNCIYCKKARELRGKNIRTRSQAIIDNKILLDFPADTYLHALQFDLDLSKVKHVLVTHSHMDHFRVDDMELRGSAYAHDMVESKMFIYGNTEIKKVFDRVYEGMPQKIKECYTFVVVKEYERIFLDDYIVTPLRARHMKDENCFIYLIQKDDISILYGNDTGYFYEDVFEYLNNNKIKLNFISLDCTLMDKPLLDTAAHMGFDNCNRVVLRLKELGVINDTTQVYVNHFSHNGNPIHENLETIAKEYDMKVSFDGLEIEVV